MVLVFRGGFQSSHCHGEVIPFQFHVKLTFVSTILCQADLDAVNHASVGIGALNRRRGGAYSQVFLAQLKRLDVRVRLFLAGDKSQHESG